MRRRSGKIICRRGALGPAPAFSRQARDYRQTLGCPVSHLGKASLGGRLAAGAALCDPDEGPLGC